jgi:hypothetical protein
MVLEYVEPFGVNLKTVPAWYRPPYSVTPYNAPPGPAIAPHSGLDAPEAVEKFQSTLSAGVSRLPNVLAVALI